MSTIKNLIMIALEDEDEIHGTENLAELLLSHNHTWVRRKLNELEASRLIRIIRTRGGRGNKNIIRRNRNSPGYPRKVK